jgi:5-methyltetrahydropteroyltriglutamate--homocysteine methyltransferase
MKHSTDRILTTHVGSLPRPDDLIDLLMAQDAGEAHDPALLARRVREGVDEIVAKQVACGIDVVSDGEMGKVSYVNYLKHRLAGFGEPAPLEWTPADLLDHPGFIASRRTGSNPVRRDPPACRAAISVKNRAPLEADLANLRAAADRARPVDAFVPAASPGVVVLFMPNKFYPSEDAYVEALAAVLREEYEAIHAAGFVVQIDCPDLAMSRHLAYTKLPLAEFRRVVARNVEAINHATRNIPADAMRMHLCWGNYAGPHTHDVPLKDVADLVFRARPQAVLFEAANPRHAHEWEDLKSIRIPDDKILVPGVIDTNTNHVEHPQLVAQRICAFADIVGRERVMAGTDCGFGTFAKLPPVYPSIAWEKLRSLVEGARLATARLWRR